MGIPILALGVLCFSWCVSASDHKGFLLQKLLLQKKVAVICLVHFYLAH